MKATTNALRDAEEVDHHLTGPSGQCRRRQQITGEQSYGASALRRTKSPVWEGILYTLWGEG
jgi:hypothetical protein